MTDGPLRVVPKARAIQAVAERDRFREAARELLDAVVANPIEARHSRLLRAEHKAAAVLAECADEKGQDA